MAFTLQKAVPCLGSTLLLMRLDPSLRTSPLPHPKISTSDLYPRFLYAPKPSLRSIGFAAQLEDHKAIA